jgi:hypothetical protein
MTDKPSSRDYTPRFSFEISEEQQARTNKNISTYGLRRAIFSAILDDVNDMIEEHGGMAIGILLSGTLKPREMIKTMKGNENG